MHIMVQSLGPASGWLPWREKINLATKNGAYLIGSSDLVWFQKPAYLVEERLNSLFNFCKVKHKTQTLVTGHWM